MVKKQIMSVVYQIKNWPRLALLAGGAYVLLQPEAPSPLPEPPALPE